jgi:hypothetical protein
MMPVLHVISFRNTTLFKRGIWLSAAALLAFVISPFILDGSLWRDPLPSLFGAAVLGIALIYFFWRTKFHRLAEEVIDGEVHLQVRRGRTEQLIPFTDIATAEVSTFSGIHRITVSLRAPGKFGAHIHFLPQASLWSSLARVQRLAASLAARHGGGSGSRANAGEG